MAKRENKKKKIELTQNNLEYIKTKTMKIKRETK